jgi:hypothetical protein
VFLQIGLGFSPFHAGLMMIPMVLGSMGMKRIVDQRQRVIPARQGAKHKQQADRRQPQSAGDQHPTVRR